MGALCWGSALPSAAGHLSRSHSMYDSGGPLRRFEAGTPAIAEAIGFGAACDYLAGLGMDNVAAYERQLGTYLHEQVRSAAYHEP